MHNKNRFNLRLITVAGTLFLASLGCRTTDVLLPAPAVVALTASTPRPTFTQAAPSPTPTKALSATAAVTKRPTARVTATRTRTLPPQPTVTVLPTISPWEYVIDPAVNMESAPNCETVYFKGKVVGRNGEPLDGVVVELAFYDNKPTKTSGRGEDPGEFGFSPLAPGSFHSPITFVLHVVRSEKDRTIISEALTINFTNCAQAGQFTKIRFKKTR